MFDQSGASERSLTTRWSNRGRDEVPILITLQRGPLNAGVGPHFDPLVALPAIKFMRSRSLRF